MASDQDLLSRIAGGDSRAMEELYDRYAPVSMALASRILADAAEAEDVLQTTFVRVWQSAGRYDGARGSPATWLLSLVRNASIDRVRRRDVRKRVLEKASSTAVNPAPPPNLPEDRRKLAQAVQSLPADQREAIELAYFRGLTQSQIAEKLRQPLGTVKTRMRLGMERLRQALGPLEGNGP